MANPRQLFVIAGLAAFALGGGAPGPRAQAGDDIAAEEAFHRLQELEAKETKLPPRINAARWREAFFGSTDGLPRPQYLASLIGEYQKLGRKEKAETVKWVDALAAELVASGDGDMFMTLATRYVRYSNADSIYSPFARSEASLGQSIEKLAGIMKKTLSTMQPDEQLEFKRAFGLAIAHQLVGMCTEAGAAQDCVSKPDFTTAVLGYDVLRLASAGETGVQKEHTDEAKALIAERLAAYIFNEEDMAGLMNTDGFYDFQAACASFLRGDEFGIVTLMEMGISVKRNVADAIRHALMGTIQQGGLSVAVPLFNQSYQAAANRLVTEPEALSAQITSPEWQTAISKAMTPFDVIKVFEHYYRNGAGIKPREFYAARQRTISAEEFPQVKAALSNLLQEVAGKPAIFYQIADDLDGLAPYRAALSDVLPKLGARQVAAHFNYLASVYIYANNFDKITDCVMRMQSLMRSNNQAPLAQRMQQKALRAIIGQYAKRAAGDDDKAYQVAKLVWRSTTDGWIDLTDANWVRHIRDVLKAAPQSMAYETLGDALRVLADAQTRKAQWKAVVQPK